MSNRCVVVIDDERDVLAVICDLLEMEGFHPVGLADPASATQSHATGHQPRLFLVDIMLPGMTGIELARTLREDGFADTPMVAMSASTSMLNAASRSQLFQATVAKPFDLDHLLETVERYAA